MGAPALERPLRCGEIENEFRNTEDKAVEQDTRLCGSYGDPKRWFRLWCPAMMLSCLLGALMETGLLRAYLQADIAELTMLDLGVTRWDEDIGALVGGYVFPMICVFVSSLLLAGPLVSQSYAATALAGAGIAHYGFYKYWFPPENMTGVIIDPFDCRPLFNNVWLIFIFAALVGWALKWAGGIRGAQY